MIAVDLAKMVSLGLRSTQGYNSIELMETATAAASAADRRRRASAAGVGRKSGTAPRLCRRGRQPHRGAWRDARRSLGVFARAGGGGAGRRIAGTVVVVAPHPGEIDSLARDLALFTELPIAEFPAWESEPGERVVHDEIYGDAAAGVEAVGDFAFRISDFGFQRPNPQSAVRNPKSHSILVTSIQSLLQPVPGRDALAEATRESARRRRARRAGVHEVACRPRRSRDDGGRAARASSRLRGGILDIFPPDADDPVRIELFGSDVESIRRFDVATQRSLGALEAVDVTMLEPTASDRAHFTAYLPPATWFMLVEPNDLQEEGKFYLDRMDRPQAFHSVRTTLDEMYKFPSVTASGVPAGSMEETAHLEFESVERFSGEIGKVRDELDKVSVGQEVFVVCETEAEVERLGQVVHERRRDAVACARRGRLHFVVGHLEAGFRIVPQQVVLVSAAELFQRHDLARTTRAGGRRGRSTASSNCGRATWWCTWRTASAAIAG